MGYTFLTREYWGEKYNRDLKHIMMSHIYQWVDTIYFAVGQHNIRSQIAMAKIGGRMLTPAMEKAKQQSVPDNVIFEIQKKDFKGLN